MLFYWVFWSIFAFFSLRYAHRSSPPHDRVLTLLIIVIAFLIGCRVDVGADWAAYMDEYYESRRGLDFVREPLFYLIELVMSRAGFPCSWFFFVLGMLHMFILRKTLINFHIKNIYLSFLIFFSLFFCMHLLNIVRHGLMISFIWLAMSYLLTDDRKKYYICILLGAGFHFLALFFLPLLFFVDKKLSPKVILTIVSVSLIAFFLGFSQHIYNFFPYFSLLDTKINPYMTDRFETTVDSFSFGQIFDISVGLFLYFRYKKVYDEQRKFRIVLNCLVFAFVINCFFNQFTIFTERLSQVFKFSLIFLFPYILQLIRRDNLYSIRSNKKTINSSNHTRPAYSILAIVFIILYSMMYMNKAINTADPANIKQYQFQPFKYDVSLYFK